MKGDDMDQMEYDPDDGREDDHDAEAGICRQCMRGDHDDCALITWATGTCQCGSCRLIEPVGIKEAKHD